MVNMVSGGLIDFPGNKKVKEFMKRRIYPTCLLMIFLMSNAHSGGPATSGNYLGGDMGTPVKADFPKRTPHEDDAGFLDYLPLVLNQWNPPGPPPGNPEGHCPIPAGAGEENTSNPNQVIGNGTPQSCTSEAVVAAVAQGGIITFNCGPAPVTIVLRQTARVFNNTGPRIVIDGGGQVTLSGDGVRRILYMNTCDPAQVWTTSHCQNQDHPQLTVQNLTFINGNSKGEEVYGGGGAVWVRGGRFKIVNSRFFNDGNTFTLSLCGTRIEHNQANEGGGAIFFVSNDRTGSLLINESVLSHNPSKGFETPGYPGIFFLGKGAPLVTDSIIEQQERREK